MKYHHRYEEMDVAIEGIQIGFGSLTNSIQAFVAGVTLLVAASMLAIVTAPAFALKQWDLYRNH